MYNFYFFDLDGTLVEKGSNEISKENLKVLKQLRKNNNLVIINTGRDLKRALAVKELEDNVDYLICSMGALLYETTGKWTKKISVPCELCKEVFDKYFGKVVIVYKTADGEKIIDSDLTPIYLENCKLENREPGQIVSTETYFNDSKNEEILNYVFVSKEPVASLISDLDITKSYDYGNDVNIKGVDKSYFIKEYFLNWLDAGISLGKDPLGDPLHHPCIAFGDGENDIPTFKVCDYSFSLLDSNSKAQENSTFIIPKKASENGVAYAIKKLNKFIKEVK